MRVVVLFFFAAAALFSQTPPPATPTEKILLEWNTIGRKLTAMAEDFPEAKYDFRPVPEIRTFADHLLHVAFWNVFVLKQVKGEKMDTKPDQFSRADFKSKAAIVKELRRGVEDAAAALKAQNEETTIKQVRLWTTFIEHSGEHYGQLVVYYRVNGIVPPESRPKK